MKQNHPLVEDYLNKVTAKIKRQHLREEIHTELLAHFEESLETDLARGLSEEASLRKTLAGFGDPALLGKKLERANKVWYWRWTYILPSIVVFAFIVCALASTVYAAKRYEMIKQAFNEKKKIRAEIVKNFAEMKSLDPLFSQTFITGRDAGEFLNSRVAWFGSQARSEYPLSLPKDLFLRKTRNPDGTIKLEHLSDDMWINLSALTKEYHIDLSWFAEIHDYDYWELSSFESPVGPYLLTRKTLSGAPNPDFGSLQTFIKLRVAQGMMNRQLLPALRDARKMTELIYSTETLMGTSFAIAMLDFIDRAAREGLQKGLIRKEEWRFANYNKDKVRLTAWAAVHWTDFFSSNEFKEELFAGHAVFGGCGALHETSFGLSNLKTFDYFNHPFWGERSFAQDMKEYETFATKQSQFCRMTTTKHLLATQASEMEPIADLVWRIGIQIPYIRQYFFFSFMSYATPNWLGAYEIYQDATSTLALDPKVNR